MAKAVKLEVVAEFYDGTVSGADPVDSRPGLIALLEYCTAHHVGIVLAEIASRFARDLIVQLTGHALAWCTDPWCGRNDPYSGLWSGNADMIGASQVQHAVEGMHSRLDFSRRTFVYT